MLKRVGLVVAGALLLVAVVYLGLRSVSDARFVLWFGLASAILAPSAFALFGSALRSGEEQLFEQLSRVPEIEKLIGEAQSQEERIALLEEERARIGEVIQVEARRQTLVSKREALEKEMADLLTEYGAVSDELSVITARVDDSPVLTEMKRMQERVRLRKQGPVVIIRAGKRELVFPESELGKSSIDQLLFMGLRAIERHQQSARRLESDAES